MDYTNQTPQKVDTVNIDSIFVWVDLLGFSNDLLNREKYNRLHTVLESFRNTFKNEKLIQSAISDAVLLEIPYTVHSWDVLLITDLFKDIAQSQLTMLTEHQKFIRGGIAIGLPINEIDRNKLIFISDGVAKAVKIESKECVWPIIGMTEEELNSLRDLTKASTTESFGMKSIACDHNKSIYYLDFTETLQAYPNKDIVNKLVMITIENIDKYKTNNHIKEKYIWMLKHLNSNFVLDIPEDYKEYAL